VCDGFVFFSFLFVLLTRGCKHNTVPKFDACVDYVLFCVL